MSALGVGMAIGATIVASNKSFGPHHFYKGMLQGSAWGHRFPHRYIGWIQQATGYNFAVKLFFMKPPVGRAV